MTLEQIRDAFRQFARNLRWGTCADCPRTMEGHVLPEFCNYTSRLDHNLSVESLALQFQLLKGEQDGK